MDYSSVLVNTFSVLKDTILNLAVQILPYALAVFAIGWVIPFVVRLFVGVAGHGEAAPVWSSYDDAEWDLYEAHEEYYNVANGGYTDEELSSDDDYRRYMHDKHDY